MRTRLTRRLDYAIHVPAELADLPLPPGMVITLVENAIKHGIEPAAGGGRIDVSAQTRGNTLVVSVADTGARVLHGGGMPGQGIGLANIRERLALLYGDAAQLELVRQRAAGLRRAHHRALRSDARGRERRRHDRRHRVDRRRRAADARTAEGKAGGLWPERAIVAEAADGDQRAGVVRRIRPQVRFLDVRMPGKSGLDVAAAIGGDCHVVFITAYDQYALQAFDAGAVDYLLKPVETDRLAARDSSGSSEARRRRRLT